MPMQIVTNATEPPFDWRPGVGEGGCKLTDLIGIIFWKRLVLRSMTSVDTLSLQQIRPTSRWF